MIIYQKYFFFRSKICFVKKEVCASRPRPDNWMMEGVRGVPLVVQNGQGSGVQFKGRPVGALPPLRSLLTLSLPKGGWETSIFYLFSSLESSLPPEPILGLPSSQFSWACRNQFTDNTLLQGVARGRKRTVQILSQIKFSTVRHMFYIRIVKQFSLIYTFLLQLG